MTRIEGLTPLQRKEWLSALNVALVVVNELAQSGKSLTPLAGLLPPLVLETWDGVLGNLMAICDAAYRADTGDWSHVDDGQEVPPLPGAD